MDDEYVAQHDPELREIYTPEGVTFDSNDVGEIGSAMEVLTGVDLDLAYSSEKLVNLDKLLMHVMASENDLEAMALDNNNSSIILIEKAFVFDFLSGFLDSEVRELDNFMAALQAVIVDARQKLSVFGHLTELFFVMEDKLHDSEELLKQSREQVLEISMQSAKLQRTLSAFKHNDWKYDRGTGLSENGEVVASMNEKPKMQMVEQKRHILRMLEKSLGRELVLEKKLSEFKQNEEDLKLKLRLTEQVSFCMEEAAEVVWGRFLEAENASEVLMGISKELVGQLQILQFSLNGLMQREDEAKWKLLDCMEQLKRGETALKKFETRNAELITDNSQVCASREKVKSLEDQLKESNSQLKNANDANEVKEEQLREMENIIDTQKENVYIAESRVESGEAKITQLTEANMELNEELSFLKNTNDSNTKKMSLVEKQLRELEIQLQHARASSEASQEQQNMLYSAIWDMETLIEELKSKVSKAEIKTENAEEQCIILSKTNLELNKEITFLRTKIESLETCLDEANDAKAASAKDVNVKTKLIMDMVMQLAMERERIHKQLSSLAEANKILAAKLQKQERITSASMHEHGGTHDKIDEVGSSVSTNSATNVVQKLDLEREVEAMEPNGPNQMYVSMAIIVLLLSLLASYLFHKNSILFNVET
ncbi:hypothetical protein CsSME_00043379 [Camellia sinensis var. sinensis]